MTCRIPRGVHLPAETKKISLKPESKDSATANATQKADGVLKSQKENVPRKNAAPKVHKGVSRLGQLQTEVKEQNQHLIAANEELQRGLTDSQQRVAEMKLQFSDLEKEKAELHKNLRNCHVLLVSAKIDPVLGERVGEAAQHKENQRKEMMSVSTDLLRELKAFGDSVSQQRARLAEIQATMTELAQSQERIMQQRENFSLEAAAMQKVLEEAEALLM